MPADRIPKPLEDIRLLDPERFGLVQALRKTILGLDSSSAKGENNEGIRCPHMARIFGRRHIISSVFGSEVPPPMDINGPIIFSRVFPQYTPLENRINLNR